MRVPPALAVSVALASTLALAAVIPWPPWRLMAPTTPSAAALLAPPLPVPAVPVEVPPPVEAAPEPAPMIHGGLDMRLGTLELPAGADSEPMGITGVVELGGMVELVWTSKARPKPGFVQTIITAPKVEGLPSATVVRIGGLKGRSPWVAELFTTETTLQARLHPASAADLRRAASQRKAWDRLVARSRADSEPVAVDAYR